MSSEKHDESRLMDKCGSRFMSNRECEYFPCHETDNEDDFNCLFCYCPLYVLGDKCGGDFRYTEEGIKDCSGCMLPHGRNACDHIEARLHEVTEMARIKEKAGEEDECQE